ncbi:MAG: helix-turn-helix domain-containing protein [Thermoanaerobacteraceae bacterium]|uniref:helix-turn-helix domain-containing protein n=1 Tax=Thermanaeromonas sp. C210 TaxID=2731925 RepID=UPI00155D33D3|nr:helix-turn-helix domain-containing protein [Thermanaeromonas sp. C210]MBE3581713.1 helix-turn-helix domain-containing protein [Thermoanaerobacteraceae bacterium]GFN23792.1 XRE family transcriptional regulator [Thermanaeromonas sp. C210]
MGRIGEELRRAREEKGITLREAEEATKIRLKYLDALEKEDFQQFPGRVYAIGFLRSYARYLGLDPQELVEELKAELPPEEEEEYRVASPREGHREKTKKRGISRWWAVVLVLFLLWGLNYLYNQSRPVPEESPQLPPPARNGGVTPPAAPPPAPSPSEPPPSQVPEISGVEVKVYVREQECWIGVRVDGKDTFSGTLRAGDTRTFRGDEAITLTLGSAGRAEVTVNGEVLPPLGKVGEVVTRTFRAPEAGEE